MTDFFMGMLFGGLQVLLTWITLNLISKSKRFHVVGFMLAKFIIYAVGISVLSRHYFSHFHRCFMGFIVGMPIFFVIFLILLPIIKRLYKRLTEGNPKRAYRRR